MKDWNDPDNPMGYEPNILEDDSELLGELDEFKEEGLTLGADEFWETVWNEIDPGLREEPLFSDTVSKWRRLNL